VPTEEPTVEATVEPTAVPTETPLGIDPAWMYVDSTDGLFVRDAAAGQITSVLDHTTAVHVTGVVVQAGQRQWAEIDLPSNGWVALSFLTFDEPEPVQTQPPSQSGPSEPPTEADWAALRNCESGGRYSVVDPSGLYHGAYQFSVPTWNGLATQHSPALVGVLPSQASPADQDWMAKKLFELQGPSPWPSCGRFLR